MKEKSRGEVRLCLAQGRQEKSTGKSGLTCGMGRHRSRPLSHFLPYLVYCYLQGWTRVDSVGGISV